MNGIVLGHVNHVVAVDGGIVDRNHLVLLRLLHGGAEYQSADTAKSVDTDLDCHKKSLLIVFLGGYALHCLFYNILLQTASAFPPEV